jgi:hypothetical protein
VFSFDAWLAVEKRCRATGGSKSGNENASLVNAREVRVAKEKKTRAFKSRSQETKVEDDAEIDH